ncbi:MAG: hypothetical protein SFY95_01825 [Planctomycetota bacterium]|nr:hypothetical protein [Planctomycetota bacterium]
MHRSIARSLVRVLVRVLVAGLLAGVLAAAGAQPQTTERDADRELAARWAERLGALDPARPELYLELGEDVADESGSPAATRLAQRLLALSFDLGVRAGTPEGSRTAVSAALAAAEMTGLERERRWLVAMARAVDRTGTLRPDVAPDAELGETAGYRAALAVGAVRAGQGLLARRLLDDESVAAILRRFNRSLTDSGSRATLQTLRREAQLWPCPRCQGQKVIKRGAGTVEICPACAGAMGPKITRGQLVAQLRFESVMLGTLPRTWASQFLMDRGEPLRDLDAADVAPTLGADVSRPVWRGAAWVER